MSFPLENKTPTFSFEFFPPRDEKMKERLWESLTFLSKLNPQFVSITYGAGGTTKANTDELIRRITQNTQLSAAAHLTCVGQSKAEVLALADTYWQRGARHLVLLRGDMPNMGSYEPHPEGFSSTPQFIRAVLDVHPFEVSVSAYPEKHPESLSLESDLTLLKEKETAGAHRAITQFCFNDELFLRLRDKAADAGIRLPIVPGIIQTTNFKGLLSMAKKSGASVPASLAAAYSDPDLPLATRQALAIDIALQQCQNLKANGVEHFHFYTLNQKKVTTAVCSALLSS